jgi:lipid-A-disaccharide synthase
MHFVSPSVWAWRRERIPKIARSVDRLLALFPFEPAVYEGSGLNVTFVGHPLAQHAAQRATRKLARERLHMPAAQPLVALLPGSRTSEVEMHADLLLDAAALVHAERPDLRFLVPLATRETRDRFAFLQHLIVQDVRAHSFDRYLARNQILIARQVNLAHGSSSQALLKQVARG